MNVISAIENTVTTTVWELQSSPTSNMVCGQANCYSNCDIDYKSNIPLDLKGRFRGPCDNCGHDLWNHHRCCAIWERVTDVRVLFDNNVTKKWVSAKDGKGKVGVLVKLLEKVLGDLNRVIDHATNELARLVEQYASLSLSGSFSAQVDNTVRLLDQKHNALNGKKEDVGQDQLQKVAESLAHMKRKQVLLNTWRENARRESIGILSSKIKKWFQL